MAKVLTTAALSRLKADPDKRREVPDGLIPGLYFVIQPSGAKSWAVRYRADGKPRKLTLGSYPAPLDLDDAREAARTAIMAAKRGADPAAEKVATRKAKGTDTAAERFSFDTVARRYLARDARKNRSWLETARLLGLKPAADDEGRDDPTAFNVIAGGIVELWGKRMIGDITRADVVDRLDAVVDRGAPVAANRTLAAVRRLFNWCCERGMIDRSPAASVKPPGAETSRDRVLSHDEIRWFWKAAQALGYPFGAAAQLLLLTGQRRDEVGDMTRSELDGSTWTIPKERAKNGVQHQVPLSETAVEIVDALPKVAGKAGYVFSTTGATPVSGWSKFKANLDAKMTEIAREETEDSTLEIPAWTLHDLRRTAASGMAALGIAVHVLERHLNHRSGTIRGVAAVYNRFDYWDERVKAVAAWARFVDGLVTGEASNVVQLRGAK